MCRTCLFSFEEAMGTYKKTKPRAYQETCVREAFKGLNRQRDVIIQLPTGMGKTYTYLPIVCNALSRGLRVCVLCPTKDNQRQIENYNRDFSCNVTPSIVYGIGEYNCTITGERADYLICLEEREKCEEEGIQCEVLQANSQFGEDRFIITNFAKFLSVRPANKFDLIVVDDSHGFENSVEQHFQISVRYGKADGLYEKYKEDTIMENFLGNFLEIFDDIFDAMPPGRLAMRFSEDYVKRFAEHVNILDKVELLKHFKALDKWDRPASHDIAYFVDACVKLTMYTFYIKKDFYAREDPDGAEVISRLSEKFQNAIVKQRFNDARIIFSSGTPGQPEIHARSCTLRQYSPNDIVVVPKEEPSIVKDWFKNLRVLEVEDVGSFKDPGTFQKSLDLTLELLKKPHVKTLMLFKNYRGQSYAKNLIEKRSIERSVLLTIHFGQKK